MVFSEKGNNISPKRWPIVRFGALFKIYHITCMLGRIRDDRISDLLFFRGGVLAPKIDVFRGKKKSR